MKENIANELQQSIADMALEQHKSNTSATPNLINKEL